MARVHVFSDEAGNFDFKAAPGATRYFILGTVTIRDLQLGTQLQDLRRELAWQGVGLESSFHATEDKQFVRDQVFGLLASADFRFDSIILEKRKTIPSRQNQEAIYKLAWFLHFKYLGPQIVGKSDDLLVVAATIGTKKRRRAIRLGIEDVVNQSVPLNRWEVAFWPSESDPCLQVADYCTWALQRKYESDDTRSYELIQSKVRLEFEAFALGTSYYY